MNTSLVVWGNLCSSSECFEENPEIDGEGLAGSDPLDGDMNEMSTLGPGGEDYVGAIGGTVGADGSSVGSDGLVGTVTTSQTVDSGQDIPSGVVPGSVGGGNTNGDSWGTPCSAGGIPCGVLLLGPDTSFQSSSTWQGSKWSYQFVDVNKQSLSGLGFFWENLIPLVEIGVGDPQPSGLQVAYLADPIDDYIGSQAPPGASFGPNTNSTSINLQWYTVMYFGQQYQLTATPIIQINIINMGEVTVSQPIVWSKP